LFEDRSAALGVPGFVLGFFSCSCMFILGGVGWDGDEEESDLLDPRAYGSTFFFEGKDNPEVDDYEGTTGSF